MYAGRRMWVWLIVLPVAALLIVPAAMSLWKSQQPIPLPDKTWTQPGAAFRKEAMPAPLKPNTAYIPSVHVKLPFREAGVKNGFLELNSAVDSGVHFANGSTLRRGTFLVAAHVNNAELDSGPFAELIDIKPGAMIVVTDSANRPQVYRTIGLNHYSKEALPGELWRTRGKPMLALATCGGPLKRMPPDNRYHYSENVVVTAVPVAS